MATIQGYVCITLFFEDYQDYSIFIIPTHLLGRGDINKILSLGHFNTSDEQKNLIAAYLSKRFSKFLLKEFSRDKIIEMIEDDINLDQNTMDIEEELEEEFEEESEEESEEEESYMDIEKESKKKVFKAQNGNLGDGENYEMDLVVRKIECKFLYDVEDGFIADIRFMIPQVDSHNFKIPETIEYEPTVSNVRKRTVENRDLLTNLRRPESKKTRR